MKQLYCQDCGEIFAEEDARVLWEDYGHGRIEHLACPVCRSLSVTDAGKCKICGSAITPDTEYCEDCKTAVYKIWEKAVCEVMDRSDGDYTDTESKFIEYLQDTGVI